MRNEYVANKLYKLGGRDNMKLNTEQLKGSLYAR